MNLVAGVGSLIEEHRHLGRLGDRLDLGDLFSAPGRRNLVELLLCGDEVDLGLLLLLGLGEVGQLCLISLLGGVEHLARNVEIRVLVLAQMLLVVSFLRGVGRSSFGSRLNE